MPRPLILLYGSVCYLLFLVTFCYAIVFVADIQIDNLVPWTVDRGGVDSPFTTALLINVALLGLFGLQHSIMARPEFKAKWTKIVPVPIERSTFVLFTCIVMGLMFWQWRPMTGVVWSFENQAVRMALYAICGFGWFIVLLSTVLINHFDLFGMRQVVLHFQGKEYTPVGMCQPFLYRIVRHPLMLGFFIAFWATPHMTVGHLVFAGVVTVYVLIAIQIEERDLVKALGDQYIQYRREVPMIIPIPKRKQSG